MKKQFFLFLILFLTLIFSVSGAQLSGTIYDLSMVRVKNAVVTVNSTPLQRIVAENGTYSIELPPGDYVLSTEVQHGPTLLTAQENLTIIDDGRYILDLFLYPEFEDENIDDFDLPEELSDKEHKSILWLYLGFLMVLLAVLVIMQRTLKRMTGQLEHARTKLIDDDLKEIIQIIHKEGGRITQKKLRKRLPYSEAKISLMITELEALEIVQKIKKGRGNVIILNKNYK